RCPLRGPVRQAQHVAASHDAGGRLPEPPSASVSTATPCQSTAGRVSQPGSCGWSRVRMTAVSALF
ncbi:MAG: hypothetical protein ACFNLH_10765, partial [Corynebacterium matruchotii]